MAGAKRVFFVCNTKDYLDTFLLEVIRKYAKGFIRLGYDIQVFGYNNALFQASPFKSKTLTGCFYKSRVDDLLVRQVRNYAPHIVFVGFARFLDGQSVRLMRDAAPNASFLGIDVDLWSEMHPRRVQAARELDLILTTYADKNLWSLGDASVKCVFMPNMSDPDVEYRYDVGSEWKSDILYTGQCEYRRHPTDSIRPQLIRKMAAMKNCTLYGCCGKPRIYGMRYFYAISGSRIGLSINADNSIRLYHSDRLTHYLSCGTFVLAKRVPDTDLLFKDGLHLRYFDTADEFFELAKWYLEHETERKKIADTGMKWTHEHYNCVKMAGHILDLVAKGSYSAPWT